MNSLSIRLVAICATTLVAMVSSTTALSDSKKGPEYIIPLMAILLNADEPYRGSLVRVSGYMHRLENLYLFHSSEHANVQDTTMGVGLVLSDEELDLLGSPCVDSFVRVVARLNYDIPGGRVLSDIQEVMKFDADGTPLVCWSKNQEARSNE